MSPFAQFLLGGVLLAIGTYIMRAGGGEIGERLSPYPRVQVAMEDGAFLILASVVAVTALTEGQSFAGFARVLGVGVSGVLAWRGVSLPIVLLVAAVVTAVARALGVN